MTISLVGTWHRCLYQWNPCRQSNGLGLLEQSFQSGHRQIDHELVGCQCASLDKDVDALTALHHYCNTARLCNIIERFLWSTVVSRKSDLCNPLSRQASLGLMFRTLATRTVKSKDLGARHQVKSEVTAVEHKGCADMVSRRLHSPVDFSCDDRIPGLPLLLLPP